MTGPDEREIPEAPDLTELFRQHQASLQEVIRKNNEKWADIQENCGRIAELGETYRDEIIGVLAIARTVQNPQTAVAAVAPVLALANKAFAHAPTVETELQALLKFTSSG